MKRKSEVVHEENVPADTPQEQEMRDMWLRISKQLTEVLAAELDETEMLYEAVCSVTGEAGNYQLKLQVQTTQDPPEEKEPWETSSELN